MRTERTRTKVRLAPLGATVLGSEIAVPPGSDRGGAGSVNRSRSRPGCALGGMTWAKATIGTANIASVAAIRHTPANIPHTPRSATIDGQTPAIVACGDCHAQPKLVQSIIPIFAVSGTEDTH